ncbi:hypothetical protein EBZ35_08290, partial [bacterium]|nr:hypothetical protein [bacterium]
GTVLIRYQSNPAYSRATQTELGRYLSGNYFDGDIGEVLVFKSSLSAQDRYLVDEYLSKKWGIAVDTDGDRVINDLDAFPTNNAMVVTLPTALSSVSANLMAWFNTNGDFDGNGIVSANETTFPPLKTTNGAVTLWVDWSGKGNSMVLPANTAPLFPSGTSFGLVPAVSFNGSQWCNMALSTPLSNQTMIVVERVTPSETIGWAPLIGSNAPTTNFMGWRTRGTTGTELSYQDLFTGGLVDSRWAIALPFTPRVRIVTAIQNGVASRLLVNGTTVASGTGSGSSVPTASLWIGRNGSDYYTGDVAEVLVFNTALTDAQRQSIETYLATRYGVVIDSDDDGVDNLMDRFPNDATKVIDLASVAPSINSLAGVASLRMWLTTVSLNASERDASQNVIRWLDWSGYRNHFVSYAIPNRPVWIPSVINTGTALRFDGLSEWMEGTGSVLAGTNYTLAIVERRHTTPIFDYVADADQWWVVPQGVTSIQVKAWGAGGGGSRDGSS